MPYTFYAPGRGCGFRLFLAELLRIGSLDFAKISSKAKEKKLRFTFFDIGRTRRDNSRKIASTLTGFTPKSVFQF